MIETEIYEKVEAYFDQCAPLYDQIHIELPWIDSWQFGNMFDRIDFSKNPVILDVGTGDGNLLIQAGKRNPSCRLMGLDLSSGMLKAAERNLNAVGLKGQFIKSNMENIPVASESVDYVVSNGAIHHVKEKASLYSEVYRILKPGGKLIVCDGFDNRDERFIAERDALQEQYPELWQGFIDDFNRFQQFLRDNVPSDLVAHPEEYHITPYETKSLLEELGFSFVEIIPSPQQYVIYTGSKTVEK